MRPWVATSMAGMTTVPPGRPRPPAASTSPTRRTVSQADGAPAAAAARSRGPIPATSLPSRKNIVCGRVHRAPTCPARSSRTDLRRTCVRQARPTSTRSTQPGAPSLAFMVVSSLGRIQPFVSPPCLSAGPDEREGRHPPRTDFRNARRADWRRCHSERMLHHVSFAADRPQRGRTCPARSHRRSGQPLRAPARWLHRLDPGRGGDRHRGLSHRYRNDAGPTGRTGPVRAQLRAPGNTATHAALSVDRTTDEIPATTAAAGWRAHPADRGGFEVVEVWVEDRVMLEVAAPAMTARYLSVVDAPRIAASGTDYQSLTPVGAGRHRHPHRVGGRGPARLGCGAGGTSRRRIDLRVGGAFELLFQPDQAAGARGSEGVPGAQLRPGPDAAVLVEHPEPPCPSGVP